MANQKEPSKKPVVKKNRPNMMKYFRGVVAEMKKVSWPTRKELINTTIIVLTFIVVFSIIVGAIDLGLGKLLELIT